MPPPTTTTDWLKPGISTLSGTLYTAYHAEHQALLVAHAQLARSLAKLKRKNKKLAATHAAALDANETLATENICLETDLRNLKIWQRREEAEERRRRAAEDEVCTLAPQNHTYYIHA